MVVNYACHNTTLRGNFKQIHGDWAACAQEFIEADHPGAVALITLGCGADADPCPHGTVELCQQHGRAMADEVKRLLAGPWQPIEGQVTARTATLEIPYDPPPPLDELRETAKKSYRGRAAPQKAGQRRETCRFPRSTRLTTWTFGDDLAMVFLSDEVVVDYALRLKRELDGSRLWINAYSNDVSVYIASNRLLNEGGYEVNNSLSALVTYGHPERVQPPLEDRIVEQVKSLLPATFQAGTGRRRRTIRVTRRSTFPGSAWERPPCRLRRPRGRRSGRQWTQPPTDDASPRQRTYAHKPETQAKPLGKDDLHVDRPSTETRSAPAGRFRSRVAGPIR